MGTLPRHLLGVMAHRYVGFHQAGHYLTLETAPTHRWNWCRAASALNAQAWTMFLPQTRRKHADARPCDSKANHQARQGADIRFLLGLQGMWIQTETVSALLRPAPLACHSQPNKYGCEEIYWQKLVNTAQAQETDCKIANLRRAAASWWKTGWNDLFCPSSSVASLAH